MADTRRRRRYLLVLGFTTVCAALAVTVAAALTWRVDIYDGNIGRIDDAVPEERGRPDDDPGENWLLIGSDMRGDTTERKLSAGDADADVIMLLHVPEGEGRAYVISFPRDSWVDIPGHGEDKLAEAFSEGGPKLLTSTVEEVGGVRVDHFAALDFAGFEDMTNALGGVTLDLPYDVYDPTNGWYWEAGENHMDGAEALRFVRERKGLSGSDLDRIDRQQVFLRAMAEKATGDEVRGDPRKLDAFLLAASGAVSVDSETTMAMMRSLALELVDIGADATAFMSVPVSSTGWEGENNVVYLDDEAMDALFDHVRDGGLADHMKENDLEDEAESME